MGEKWAGVWMSVQQGKWRVPSRGLRPLSREVQGREFPKVGSGEEPTWPQWVFPPMFQHQKRKVSTMKKRVSQAFRQRKIYYRKRESGFREKPVLSLYSQPFLYLIDGKLHPNGRGP